MTSAFVIAAHSRIRIPVTSSEGGEGADQLEKSPEAVVLMWECMCVCMCALVWAGTDYQCGFTLFRFRQEQINRHTFSRLRGNYNFSLDLSNKSCFFNVKEHPGGPMGALIDSGRM